MLEIATVFLVVITFFLAVATVYLAYHTHRLVSLSSVTERIRLSMEQNWKLWEHRNEVVIPVAFKGFTPEEWGWRIGLLGHLNLLQLEYRHTTFGFAKFFGKRPEHWVDKSTREIRQAREDEIGKAQLRQLLQPGEGFPQDFIRWMEKQGIVRRDDYL